MSLIIEYLKKIADILLRVLEFLLDVFLSVSIFEKINIINFIPAFFAIILPVGRYYIFGTFYYINNPLAVYMIGIVILMTAGLFIEWIYYHIIKAVIPLYYAGWMIYLHLSGTMSGAPYEITAGYYVNIICPAIFVTSSLMGLLIRRSR